VYLFVILFKNFNLTEGKINYGRWACAVRSSTTAFRLSSTGNRHQISHYAATESATGNQGQFVSQPTSLLIFVRLIFAGDCKGVVSENGK
jgi:hypothetical protein